MGIGYLWGYLIFRVIKGFVLGIWIEEDEGRGWGVEERREDFVCVVFGEGLFIGYVILGFIW